MLSTLMTSGNSEDNNKLLLLDSFTGTKKSFIPVDPDNVTIYICGPTVYDDAHLGHARTYVTFDLIRRIFDILGYRTTVVMNITDIDDKIINRADERNISPLELARLYEQRFMEDMGLLSVQQPDVLTKVTDHINEIIDFIKDLIEKGYAYEKDGDVRFNISKYREFNIYPGFNLHSHEESGESVDSGDFALWKGIKEGINWNSPWGYGRPGWHIECSTMATSVFGPHLDIHVGGVDLSFPHHANEIAQTQSKTGTQWVNTFLHIGHLSIDGYKMSKSLKNFISIRKALEDYSPHILRMYFVLHKYNAPISFSNDELEHAKKIWGIFQAFSRKVTGLPSELKWNEKSQVILQKLTETRNNNKIALRNDFDLPKVILNLLNLISFVHVYNTNDHYPIAALMVLNYIQKFLTELGFPKIDSTSAETTSTINIDLIQKLVDFRSEVRNAAGDKKLIYEITDKIRLSMTSEFGVKIEDQGIKSYWSYDK